MSEQSPRTGVSTGVELLDGWVTIEQAAGRGLHVRLSNRDGRAVITDIYLHGADLDTRALQAISTTKIHSAASDLRDDSGLDAASIADSALANGVPEPTLAELRQRTPTRRRTSKRERVTRPAGIEPGVFYARVAEAYREFAATTGRAASAAIAAEANVPVTTAHRWVREARRLGFLPRGTRGRTG